MQSFVSQGKNVKEAIQLGLESMEAKKKEVSIEIIALEKKGFMGIGRKKAVVKLTKFKEETPVKEEEMDLETIDRQIDRITENFKKSDDRTVNASYTEESDKELRGKAWVENGKLFVKDSPDQYPLVTIDRGVQLLKNNELVTEKQVVVTERDKVKIKLIKEEQDTKWRITVDKHRLQAILEVKPGYKLTHMLEDIQPNERIKLAAEEKKEIINTMKQADVMEELENLRIKNGINYGELERALQTKEEGSFEIASGKKAMEGKDGWVELKVEVDTKDGLEMDATGKINYREIQKIPTVDSGKVIAIIHSPVPGNPGSTITNEPLPPRQTNPVILRIGKGVTAVDNQIVATDSGRPLVEQRGLLVKASVLPKLVHHGDVDLKSGNIYFNGDIEITGEVQENMMVEAGGDILIHRMVQMAAITASDAIIVKRNVVASELSAGKNNMLVAELGYLLGTIHKQVEGIIRIISQLQKNSSFKANELSGGGLQPLIMVLIEKKFKELIPSAKKYVAVTKKGEKYLEEEDWHHISVAITQIFLTLSNQITTLEKLTRLSEKMKKMHEFSEELIEPDSYIIIPSALDSRLYCSGDVTVNGQGCVNTKIHAGGELKITGILRGGRVYGRMGAEIEEAGSVSGSTTIIAVPGDQIIRINKAHEGTKIVIGNNTYIFREMKQNVTARLNKSGRIVFG